MSVNFTMWVHLTQKSSGIHNSAGGTSAFLILCVNMMLGTKHGEGSLKDEVPQEIRYGKISDEMGGEAQMFKSLPMF